MKTITLQFHVNDDAPELEEKNGRITLGDVQRYLGGEALADRPGDTPTIYLITEEGITRQAEGIAAREYRDTVKGFVSDLYRAVADGEVTDEDGAREYLEQSIDGCSDVIYTARAMEVCRQSRNDGAYFDDFGTDGAVTDGGIEWSKLAYCALLADVLEEINLTELFRCDTCAGDVDDESRVQSAAKAEVQPTCADCAGDDEDDDASEDDQAAE